MTSERENGLVENNVPRDMNPVCREIKAAVAFVIRRISKKETRRRPRCQLVGSSGGHVGKTKTSENPKVIIRRRLRQKSLVRSRSEKDFGWPKIEKMGGSREGVSPVLRRHVGLN